MSILRISRRNLLAAVAPTQIETPPAAPGCVGADLVRGGPAAFWQPAGAALQHLFYFDLEEEADYNFIAAFDVHTDSALKYIQVSASKQWPWVNEGWVDEFNVNDRGDGGRTVVTGRARSFRIAVVLWNPGTIRVGEFWVGEYADTQRAYATLRPTLDYPAIENETEVGGARVTQLGDYRHRFELGFDRLYDGERGELVSIFHSARGSRDPIVLIPNTADPSQLYHGRIGRSIGWTQDFPVNEGISLVFQESGRALGG